MPLWIFEEPIDELQGKNGQDNYNYCQMATTKLEVGG